MDYSRVLLRAALGVAVAGFVVATVPPASAQVLSPQQALPSSTIQQFLNNPSGLLTQFPNGGPDMIKEVRDLAASDPKTLNALIALLANANPDQAGAIGTGLGQAAELAVPVDPAYADQIQTAVIVANSNFAVVAFSAVVGGDIKLAAATGGGGGGGGEEGTGSGGPNFGFGGGSILTLHPFATNTPDSFTIPTFTPGTPGTPSTSPSTP
jgi:hypothetical protein